MSRGLFPRWSAIALSALLSGVSASAQTQDVAMVFVGDLMLAELPGKRIAQGHDPFEPFASVLNQSDIRIGNLECVISTIGKAEDKPFTFRAHPRVLKLLKKHFDAVSLANNHTGDFGPAAFGQMLDFLTQAKIPFFGGGRDLQHAHTPMLFKRQGLTIAVLGYNEFFPAALRPMLIGLDLLGATTNKWLPISKPHVKFTKLMW